MTHVRLPHYAGRSYFADAGRLRASVEAFIEDAAQPALSGSLCALIVPRGTHGEIGPLAGHAYKLLLSLPLPSDPVLILAPAASQDHAAAVQCDPASAYITPLGQMQLDAALLSRIEHAGLSVARAPDQDPHVESHLPFLQVALGDEPFVPLRVTAGLDPAAPAWQAIAGWAGLLIAIADLPAGRERGILDALMRLDDRALAQVRRWPFVGPAVKPFASADLAVLALAVRLARARGADRAATLAFSGTHAALALYRD